MGRYNYFTNWKRTPIPDYGDYTKLVQTKKDIVELMNEIISYGVVTNIDELRKEFSKRMSTDMRDTIKKFKITVDVTDDMKKNMENNK